MHVSCNLFEVAPLLIGRPGFREILEIVRVCAMVKAVNVMYEGVCLNFWSVHFKGRFACNRYCARVHCTCKMKGTRVCRCPDTSVCQLSMSVLMHRRYLHIWKYYVASSGRTDILFWFIALPFLSARGRLDNCWIIESTHQNENCNRAHNFNSIR